MAETLTSLLSSFFSSYYELILSLFSAGLAYLLGGAYSNMCIILSVMMLACYFIFSSTTFLAVGVIAAIAFLILKNSGM